MTVGSYGIKLKIDYERIINIYGMQQELNNFFFFKIFVFVQKRKKLRTFRKVQFSTIAYKVLYIILNDNVTKINIV